MTQPQDFYMDTEEGTITVTITPLNENLPGGIIYSTGVYNVHQGGINMGDIIFDENNEWEYTGIDDFTHDQLLAIVAFILQENKKDV